jgi:beta-lactamase class D
MKKILQIPLILLILAQTTAFAQAIWNGKADTKWYNDSLSEFIITTPEQLAGLAKLVNNGNNFMRKTVKLGANIMLNDTANWRNWAKLGRLLE